MSQRRPQSKPRGFVELPRSIDFDVYGLEERFPGDRVLGLWDREDAGEPVRQSSRVYRVTTSHYDPKFDAVLSVHTVRRSPRPGGWKPFGFVDAAGSAIQSAIGKAEWREPGVRRGLDLPDLLRLSDNPDDPRWQRTRLRVGGRELEAQFLPIGPAWAAAVELGDVVIAVSGSGMQTDEYELVPIADLTAYRSLPWPRSWR